MSHNIEELRMWIRWMTVVAAIATTSFPVLYSLTPWRTRLVGRLMMLQGVTFAAAMNLSLMFQFWRPSNIILIFWVDAFILTAIAISTSSLTIFMWHINRPRKKEEFFVKFTSSVYDGMKKVAQIYLPALGTLYFAIAQIWHIPSAEEVVGTIVAVDTFLGVVLGISSATYNNSDERFAGTVSIDENDEGSTMRLMNFDPVMLATRPEITFKIVKNGGTK